MEFYKGVTLSACPLVPTPLCPPALSAFRSASGLEKLIQESVKAYWALERSRWEAGPGWRNAFPSFPFRMATGTEADLLISWVTEFKLHTQSPIHFEIKDYGLRSASEIRRSNTHDWLVAWTE